MAAFVFTGCKKDSDDKYSVTLSANNAEWGTVAGGGDYADGTEISIMATANSGYHFEKWSDDDANNPRTLTVTKNIALIAVFAEGNDGGTVNGGNSDNNNSGNNGTATGDILPKKVTKIVETWEDAEDGKQTKIYLFDSQGRITKSYREGESYNSTFEYTENSIKSTEDDRYITIFNIENGRITFRTNESGERKGEYGYSPDGYLISRGEEKYTVENGLITKDSYWESDGNSTEYNWEGKFTYGNNLNNLNVDLFLFLLEIDDDAVFTGLYGNRIKLLPTVVEETDYYTNNGIKGDVDNEKIEITYEYSGEYITKIKVKEIEDSKTFETIYEIFY